MLSAHLKQRLNYSTAKCIATQTWELFIMQQFDCSFWANAKLKHYGLYLCMRAVLWRMFLTVLTCTHSSPMLFSPLTKQHAAGCRSRQRQQIRGTEEKRENGGGIGGRTPWPQSTMSYLVLCPPCRYLLHMDVETVHSCFLPAETGGSMQADSSLQIKELPQVYPLNSNCLRNRVSHTEVKEHKGNKYIFFKITF